MDKLTILLVMTLLVIYAAYIGIIFEGLNGQKDPSESLYRSIKCINRDGKGRPAGSPAADGVLPVGFSDKYYKGVSYG